MERTVPWKALLQIIKPHWPNRKTGRLPFVPLHLEFAALSSRRERIPDETASWLV